MAQATLDATTSVAVQPGMALQGKVRSATMEAAEDIIYGSVSTPRAQKFKNHGEKSNGIGE